MLFGRRLLLCTQVKQENKIKWLLMDMQLSVRVHFIVSLIQLSEPKELIYSHRVRYGSSEEFHFLLGQSFRGETCHCVGQTLNTEINDVLQLHKCTSV